MTYMNLVGRRLGRFELLEELGRGGMAVVYKARQTDLARIVALKVLPPELSVDKNYIARFQHEARSAAALEHPHIVPIYEVGAVEGMHYIAMKYIGGQTLKQIVEEHGALDTQEAVAILSQVAEALDYAHSRGIIHRDIKPSNVMIDQGGWVYLTDFGLARGSTATGLTVAGAILGTPEYMSPEQAEGSTNIGPPTDLYALGIILYELLTGRIPFQANTPMAMLFARLRFPPRPLREYRPDLSVTVEGVVMRALARKPGDRYPTAVALVAALKRAAAEGAPAGDSPKQPLRSPHATVVLSNVQLPESAPAKPPAAPATPSQRGGQFNETPNRSRVPQPKAPPTAPAGDRPAAATPPILAPRPAAGTPVAARHPASLPHPAPATGPKAWPSRGVFLTIIVLALVLGLIIGFLALVRL